MDIKQMQARAVGVAAKYRHKNQAAGQHVWDASAYMAGFVADVGELSEFIMAKSGYRHVDDVDAKIAHELSDCLFSVLVLAHELGIDVETEFERTMKKLDERLA